MQPNFDFQSLDIVGCGSTIGNLIRCAGGQPKPFRFDANVVGDTVLFVRRENSPTEIIAGLTGWGQTFPQAYTTYDTEVRNSCSHQRVIQYDFGGVEILIRTETDGYIRPASPSNTLSATGSTTLEETLDGITISTQVPAQGGTLEIRMAGNVISQDQIFDIKTRATYNSYSMEEILPRLWANQTHNFVIAYHDKGLFDHPEVTSITKDVLRWESANSSMLARFHALVKRIMDVVKDSDHSHFEVSWDGTGPLCITEQVGEGRNALPPDLSRLWDNQ